MKILTIIERSRPGLLAEVTTLLESRQVNVDHVSGETVNDQAVIMLRAQPYERGYQALVDAGFTVLASEQLLVRIHDHPGALADLSRRLANAEVDIRSIHFLNRDQAQCIVAVEAADPERAAEVLRDQLVISEDQNLETRR